MKKWITAAVMVVSVMCFSGNAFALTGIFQPTTFPIKITKSGSFQLQSNIVVPKANMTAILVQADDVTIELNGYAIIGPTVCTGAGATLVCAPLGTGRGIDAAGHQNIKVCNGTIRGLGSSGIVTGKGAIIESVRVTSNGLVGINVFSGTVTGNTAFGNGSSGIEVSTGTVSNNTAADNGINGISVSTGTVSNNTASGNATNGIIVGTGLVSGNTANENGIDGISVTDGTVSNNTASANASNGIEVSGATVSNNTVFENGSNGIVVDGGTVIGNTAIGNTSYGLNLGVTVGYVNNVLISAAHTYVNGGVTLGQNLCNALLCP